MDGALAGARSHNPVDSRTYVGCIKRYIKCTKNIGKASS
jgi:hypothetical protein